MLGIFLWCCAEIAANILTRTKFNTRGIKHGQLSRLFKSSWNQFWGRGNTPRRGGALPINGLMGMCRWMGSQFHDWTDYNGVAFPSIFYRVTRMGSHFSGILRVRKFWQVVIYKRKDSPKKKCYRIYCCCLIFDKRLPLHFRPWNHNLNINQLHNSPEQSIHIIHIKNAVIMSVLV